MTEIITLPKIEDHTIRQGATWRLHYRWLPGGEPADLTGWSARMQIRSTYADSDPDGPLLEFDTETGGIVLDELGNIIVTATADESEDLTRNARRYDLELIDSDGEVIRFAQGRIRLKLEVTR